MSPRVTIDIDGLPDLLRKMRGNSAYAWPWKRLITTLTRFGVDQSKERAPRERGGLAGAITDKIMPGELPLWAVISTKPGAAERDGFRYGFALDAGKRRPKGQSAKKLGRQGAKAVKPSIIFHYRTSGKPTKQWFSGVRNLVQRIIRREMRKAEREIEEGFNR